MPVYEYICKSCGHGFEELVSMAERDEGQSCPACGRKTAARQQSVFSAQQGANRRADVPGPCGQCEHAGRCGGGNF